MINAGDITQLIALCAIIFIPLGYLFHRFFPHWWNNLQDLLLSPRYLKSAGFCVRDSSGSSSQIQSKK